MNNDNMTLNASQIIQKISMALIDYKRCDIK